MKPVGLLLVSLLLSALTACASNPSARPGPEDDRHGAPTPTSPRDVRAFASDPCSGPLDEAAWASLGYPQRGALRTLPTGEASCRLTAPSRASFVSFIVVGGRDVLVDTYRARQFAIFTPNTVGGLPATREQASASSLSCSVTVGTALGQGFVVNFDDGSSGPDGRPDDPCGQGQRVAEQIVAALPPLPG